LADIREMVFETIQRIFFSWMGANEILKEIELGIQSKGHQKESNT